VTHCVELGGVTFFGIFGCHYYDSLALAACQFEAWQVMVTFDDVGWVFLCQIKLIVDRLEHAVLNLEPAGFRVVLL
jgi:hypothetical protein